MQLGRSILWNGRRPFFVAEEAWKWEWNEVSRSLAIFSDTHVCWTDSNTCRTCKRLLGFHRSSASNGWEIAPLKIKKPPICGRARKKSGAKTFSPWERRKPDADFFYFDGLKVFYSICIFGAAKSITESLFLAAFRSESVIFGRRRRDARNRQRRPRPRPKSPQRPQGRPRRLRQLHVPLGLVFDLDGRQSPRLGRRWVFQFPFFIFYFFFVPPSVVVWDLCPRLSQFSLFLKSLFLARDKFDTI